MGKAMKDLGNPGRILFAIPIVVFGIQYFTYGRFTGGLPPAPPWAPGGAVLAYLTGALLVAAGVNMAINAQARLSATVLGIFFFLCVVFLHAMRLNSVIHNGNDRTRAFEALALGCAAWVLAGSLPVERRFAQGWETLTGYLANVGLCLFAVSLVVFGAQHFMYAPFIATLIPSWIPAHLFWVYFTGAGFIATALAIITRIQAELGAALLGIMFLLWVVFLHAPRVWAQPHNGDELTSAFVALAMAGASFLVAAAARLHRTT
jgi:uncharacterized membrane protein